MAKSRYNEIYYRKIKKGPNRNVYLERFFEYLEGGLKNYGLDTCCLLFPLRKGLLIIGYFNVFLNTILLIGAATGTISPLFMKIQESMEDGVSSTAIGVAIPATEIAFFVVLLCATHRNDVGLLRFYMVYGCAAIALTIVCYAVVMINLSMLFIFALFASVSYQAYILLLARSLIVKIRQAKCEVRMMSLKDLLNRREIDVEAPAPVHRPVPKDLGPGPLAAIVGNPKVEIVVKTEPTDTNEDKTLGEIKRDIDVMVEEVKKSNVDIEVKNDEATDKFKIKDSMGEIIERNSKEEEPKGKATLNAKLKFLGMKKSETKSKQLDKLNTKNDNEFKEDSKDKDDKKPKKTIFGSNRVEPHEKSKKTVEKETGEKEQTTEGKEKSKDKKEGKQKKSIFGVKIKDTNIIADASSRNEPVPGSAEPEHSKSVTKNNEHEKKQNSNEEETEGKVGTKISNNDVEIMNKTETMQTNLKETKPIKIKKKIQKETKRETDEMEEVKLDVDPDKERTGGTKLETIEEEPRRKWFWKK